MSRKTRLPALVLQGLGLLMALSLVSPGAFASCASDKHGDVYCGFGLCMRDVRGVVHCSRFVHGGVAMTREGRVLCGKGACVASPQGRVYCSALEHGSALIDNRGRVRCQGKCEPASTEYCETTRADLIR